MESGSWQYTVKVRNIGRHEETESEAERHIAEMAAAGWELVSTSALWSQADREMPEYKDTVDMWFTWRRRS